MRRLSNLSTRLSGAACGSSFRHSTNTHRRRPAVANLAHRIAYRLLESTWLERSQQQQATLSQLFKKQIALLRRQCREENYLVLRRCKEQKSMALKHSHEMEAMLHKELHDQNATYQEKVKPANFKNQGFPVGSFKRSLDPGTPVPQRRVVSEQEQLLQLRAALRCIVKRATWDRKILPSKNTQDGLLTLLGLPEFKLLLHQEAQARGHSISSIRFSLMNLPALWPRQSFGRLFSIKEGVFTEDERAALIILFTVHNKHFWEKVEWYEGSGGIL